MISYKNNLNTVEKFIRKALKIQRNELKGFSGLLVFVTGTLLFIKSFLLVLYPCTHLNKKIILPVQKLTSENINFVM
ncbi:hypothetical protein SAMN05216436_110119 [bacterium A37T11]|nr:hypothetical protein SAMN05216436_110119 [bacterium A37T11]